MIHIGIDVGGTNMVAGAVDDNCRILSRAKVRTACFRDGPEAVGGMVSIAQQAAEAAGFGLDEVASVGVGIPGGVDSKGGIALKAVNAPFDHTPVRALFQARWDVPVYLENDACCAVLGEGLAGCGRDSEFLMMITLGTGVGGSYLVKTAGGYRLCATEIGHTVIRAGGEICPCGRRGCWERYSSATGLKRQTAAAMLRDRSSLMWTLCQGGLDKVSGKTAFQAMEQGDPAGTQVVRQYLSDLADGLSNAVNLFLPDTICLGGGVAHEKEENLLRPVQKLVEERTATIRGERSIRFARAELGGDAGIVGAAMLELLRQPISAALS